MQGRFCSRSIAIGGIFLMAAAGALTARARAQQFNGLTALDPQLSLARSYTAWGLNAGFGASQQAWTTTVGSGTMGLLVESNVRDGAGGPSGNLLGPPLFSQRQDWFAAMGNPEWKTISANYKSNPALLNGIYTTASFGVTDFRTSGFSGLPNFSGGNDMVGVTARAGLGFQLTPQITIEGSVGWTQLQGSAFR